MALDSGNTPQGLSGSAAIALVQAYANEPNLPATATILSFLNRGVEQVAGRVNGIFKWTAYPTVANQTYIQLNNDIAWIASCNFSSGSTNTSGYITSSSPLSQGTLVYPMIQLEQAMFMDAAAGFPAVGFGPPQAYFIYDDEGYSPQNTLPVPAAPVFATTSGASTVTSVKVEVTYVNANGETPVSAASTQALTSTQAAVVLSPQGVSNASGYNVYVYDGTSAYWLQNSSPVALGTPYTIPNTPLTTGTNPPSSNTATGVGTGGAMFMQLYPSAMIGQVNVYYRARPLLWNDSTTSSWTSLDTLAQEAVLCFATMRVLQARGRSGEAAQIWRPEFEDHIKNLTEMMNQRTRPRSGMVRDVSQRAYPQFPPFARG